ncbi:MAG: DUF4192 family protein [Microbacteriaceae bacterium]
MPHIVKADSAADFLALVPLLVGHQPHESLVLVGFHGNRTHGAFRFDLPGSQSELVFKRAATSLIGMLCKLPGVDAVVPVIYTNQTFDESGSGPVPLSGFADRIIARARSAGFFVRGALCVAQNGWGSYLPDSIVPGAHPLAEIASSAIQATLPAGLQQKLITPVERAELPSASARERSQVQAAVERCHAALTDPVPGCEPVEYGKRNAGDGRLPKRAGSDLARAVIRALLLAVAALDWPLERPPTEDVATLLVMLGHHGLRDTVMLQFAWGQAAGFGSVLERLAIEAAAARPDAQPAVATPIIDTVLGIGNERPDAQRVERAIQLLKAVAARAPRGQQPAALCMAGWLNWALGRSSVAALLVAMAREIDPGYSFANLLLSMLECGRLPDWAFLEPSPRPGS